MSFLLVSNNIDIILNLVENFSNHLKASLVGSNVFCVCSPFSFLPSPTISGNILPIYQSYPESEIKDSLEAVKDPFENSESIFLSTDSRVAQRRKRERKDGYRKGVHKHRSKRIDYEDKEDLDIQAEIDRHGTDNVRIIQ